ncbi:MAG TPA: universal stress protein [Terriglobales bacterium]|nr:universal stress protein [Terriglobales bacterium]
MGVTLAVPAPQVRLKDILFATDFSEGSQHALPYVGALARAFRSALHLCHIDPDVPLTAGVAAPSIYEATGKLTAEHLTALLNAPALKGANLNLALGSGNFKDELGNIIRDRNIDLVVAGSHGRTGVRKMLLGSVVEEIIRTATCPVLTVGPGTPLRKDVPFHHILFPTDLSETSEQILPYITLMANEFGARVTVLHVIPPSQVQAGDGHSLRHLAERAMIESLQSELVCFHPEYLVEEGEPVEAILRVAFERKADLIAMGIKNAFKARVQLRSSNAYRIMAGAHCPVLSLRCEPRGTT